MNKDIQYYNEDVYLNKDDNEAIKYLYISRDRINKKIALCNDTYNNNINIYNDYIKFIAYFVKILSIPNNAISSSIILKLLIDRGTFSLNGKFKYTGEFYGDLIGCLGINVILGNGVCRHVSAFHRDVFNQMNLLSDPFYCYISEKDTDDSCMKQANHAMNLIEYKDNLYCYDITNNGVYAFYSDKKLMELFSDKPNFAYYKPYVDMIYSNMNVDNVNYLLGLFDILKNHKIISLEEYRFICNYCSKTLKKNKSLINDFHHSSKKYIKEIVNGIK